ncbi:HlyD family type I secretion periplasmic adaptor subunit [Nitrincola nitratireducens]|uniref:Membrane fusion protein (MFP) family protein n=1 Tax=Nitrincola nitratireducens TaxID=1229521 RepID=W9UYB4_9GAMM|nr:HlyD family type I secretion periplasmic adaptor subunit [Nitrincola nitratireducens]EXJ12228.1 Type I secretion system membrane fusion protein PrsE [Nitrincola nitratireducens]
MREGDSVEAGQLLVRLDRTRAEAAYLETRAQYASLSAISSRLLAEALDQSPVFPDVLDDYPSLRANQMALKQKRQAALNEELAALAQVRGLLEQELRMNRPLLASGDVSRTELLRLERQVAEMNAQITNKRNAYMQEVQSELTQVMAELSSVEQQLAQRRNLMEQTELFAPMSGIVKNVRINTLGGVIRPGEEVMQIVPLEDDLLIEAKINPGDIAFLHVGLDARVKIDAYDFTIYGDLPGRLMFISADTLTDDLQQGEQPYYRIRVRTDGRKFSATDRELDIQPGMTATVEIKTGRRTVLQYLTKPIIKTLSESMGER